MHGGPIMGRKVPHPWVYRAGRGVMGSCSCPFLAYLLVKGPLSPFYVILFANA